MNTEDEMLDRYMEYHYMINPYGSHRTGRAETFSPETQHLFAMWDKIKEQIRKDPEHTMFRRLMRRHTIAEESIREWAVWKWVYTFEMHRNAKYPWDGKLGGPLYDVWAEGSSGTTGEQ